MIWVLIVNRVDVAHTVWVLLDENPAPELVEDFPKPITLLKILPVAVRKLASIGIGLSLEAT